MKKNLLFASIALVALLGVTSCTKSPSSTPVSTPTVQPSTSTPVSTPTPISSTVVNPTTPPISSSAGFVDPAVQPEAETLAEGTIVRAFNPNFDVMLDDFSSKTPSGIVGGDAFYQEEPYLSVPVHSQWTNFPGTADGAIYKVGSSIYAFQTMDAIGIKVRLKNGSPKIGLENLVMGLRGGDEYKIHEIKFSDAIDQDGSPLSEITEEYQEILVSPSQTISDSETVYKNQDGTDSTLRVLSSILGIHIYATGNCKADLEIAEIVGYRGDSRVSIDNFTRTAVNEADVNCWWRDSVGNIEVRNVDVANGTYAISESDATVMQNVVLAVKGDTSTLTVAPIRKDASKGSSVAWSSLKDSDNKALPAALKNAYANYVINIENSGLGTDVIGVELASTTGVKISQVFLSDLVDILPQDYPTIDVDSIRKFDDFNRTQTTFDTDWDTSATNSVVTGAGLNGCVAYSLGDGISVSNGSLNLKATEGYTNFVEGSKTARTTEQYLVFSMKYDGEGSFDNFRIQASSTGSALYFNDWYAAPATKSAETPYTSPDGYKWYVIDLEESKISNMTDTITFFYTGPTDLHIDEVFYADAQKANKIDEASKVSVNTEGKTLDFADGGYQYFDGLNLPEELPDVLAITLKGDGTTTLESFRLQVNTKTQWAKDNALYDIDGLVIDATSVLPEEFTTIYIDLGLSGYENAETNSTIIHAGAFDGKTGVITVKCVDAYYFADGYVENMVSETRVVENNGYNYIGGSAGGIGGPKFIEITFSGDLTTLRLAGSKTGEYWVKDSKLILADGKVLDPETVATEDTTIVIDLVASGFVNNEEIHMHNGSDKTTSLTIKSVRLICNNTPYAQVISQYYTPSV